MKAYQRRETRSHPYFKVSAWDARSVAWRPVKATATTEAEARGLAGARKGTYRVERFDEAGGTILGSFEV